MNIRAIVDTLCLRHKTVNPYEIADLLGINIISCELGEINGYYFYDHRIKQVFLNYNLSEPVKKFVLSHEIGHSILHPNLNVPFLQTTFFSIDKYEMQANKFAIELLIPEDDLMGCGGYDIEQLSMEYGLPREIIELRIRGY